MLRIRRTGGLKLRALLRLTLYLGFLAVCSAAYLAHSVHAELGEQALSIGRELDRAPRQLPGTTTLRVNGQEMSLNSSVIGQPVDEVVDRFIKLCGKSSGGMRQDLAAAIASGAKLPNSEEFGMFRSERGQRDATAACVARGGSGGMKALVSDLGRALESGDLGALGQFRYVYARKARHGSGTHVISIWSHGSLKLAQMFPDRGDVTGSDLVEGARPPASVRVLSAEGVNNTYQAVFYESREPVASALDGYGRALEQKGYKPMLDEAALSSLPVSVRVYRRSEQDEVALLAEAADGKTTVSGFRLGTRGYVTLDL
jgi:hypothetical protein